MPYLCGAVLTATYFYVLLLSINATAHLEDNDADTAININDSNNNNNYLKRQLKKYHWRPYQLPQQQRHQHHHNKEHTQTPELPRKEPIFERSQEIASNSGRTRSRALRHHSRSSSSRRHRVSISRNTVGAGDDDHASGVGDVTSGGQRLNKGKKLLFRDHGLQIEVFEDIIGKLMQLSRDGSVQSAQISSGILGLALDPNYYELWKEGPQKQDQPKQQQQQQQQQQLLHLYLQRQRQQKQQLKEEHSLAHKKPRHSVYVCPKKDSSFQLACPGLDSSGTTTCIRDTELCDGVIHCPDGEDENSTVCMFYTMIRNAINKITQTLFENLPRK